MGENSNTSSPVSSPLRALVAAANASNYDGFTAFIREQLKNAGSNPALKIGEHSYATESVQKLWEGMWNDPGFYATQVRHAAEFAKNSVISIS